MNPRARRLSPSIRVAVLLGMAAPAFGQLNAHTELTVALDKVEFRLVPEPSAALLALLGLATGLLRRRRASLA